MPAEALRKALFRAQLALPISLGLFLLHCGVETVVGPEAGAFIWAHFYGIDLSASVGYLFGTLEIAVALCMILGQFRTVIYGAALLLHTVTVLVTSRQLLDPWGDPINHLFTAALPVWGGFLALFLMRRWDRGLLEQERDELS